MFKALILGESPTLVSIVCKLHFSNFSIACHNPESSQFISPWKIQLNDNEFTINVLPIQETKPQTKFDLIFLDPQHSIEGPTRTLLLNCTHETSIVIVDCTEEYFLYRELTVDLQDTTMLACFSEIDCKQLYPNSKHFRIKTYGLEEDVITIGKICRSNMKSHATRGLVVAQKSQCLKALLKENDFGIKLILHRSYKGSELKKMCSFHVIRSICLHSVSVIFKEKNIFKLLSNPEAAGYIKGSFHELLKVFRHVELLSLAKPNSAEADNFLQYLILFEGNRYLKAKSLQTAHFNDLAANVQYFNYSVGNPLSVERVLDMVIGFNYKKDPFFSYLISLHKLILLVLQKKSNTKIMRVLHPVNGIPPEKNMMNYPPFNPLPPPTTPTNFTIQSTTFMAIIEAGDNDSVVSVDSGVKELINEYAPETFYDSQSFSEEKQNGAPPVPVPVAAQVGQNQIDQNQMTQNPVFVGQKQVFTGASGGIGSQLPLPSPAHTHIPHRGYVPYVPKKKPSFRNLQPNLNQNSSIHQLRERHANILESTRMDAIVDVPNSPYGKYDTTIIYLNSANNSRGSKSTGTSKK